MFYEKGVLRNFTKFTGKHLCQSLFFNKVAGLRLATFLKKKLWHRCFAVNFAKFLRTPLDDCFCALRRLATGNSYCNAFKNICCCKIGCGKHYRLLKYFIKFPRTPSGTAKATATFKETTDCKIPQAVRTIGAPGTDFS